MTNLSCAFVSAGRDSGGMDSANDDIKGAVRALLRACIRRAAEALELQAAEALASAAELRQWEPKP